MKNNTEMGCRMCGQTEPMTQPLIKGGQGRNEHELEASAMIMIWCGVVFIGIGTILFIAGVVGLI